MTATRPVHPAMRQHSTAPQLVQLALARLARLGQRPGDEPREYIVTPGDYGVYIYNYIHYYIYIYMYMIYTYNNNVSIFKYVCAQYKGDIPSHGVFGSSSVSFFLVKKQKGLKHTPKSEEW